jgi:hypothetical protein
MTSGWPPAGRRECSRPRRRRVKEPTQTGAASSPAGSRAGPLGEGQNQALRTKMGMRSFGLATSARKPLVDSGGSGIRTHEPLIRASGFQGRSPGMPPPARTARKGSMSRGFGFRLVPVSSHRFPASRGMDAGRLRRKRRPSWMELPGAREHRQWVLVGQARCLTFVIALVRLGYLCRHPVTCDKEVLRRHPHERTAYANCRDEQVRDTR